jgi:hypothetical protein
MLNYKKLMALEPTEYDRMINSLGQEIVFYEHPLRGDEFPVIIVCHELKLADYTDFMETDDMVASHKEYEPSFQEEKLHIGQYTYR